MDILDGIEFFLEQKSIEKITEIIGTLIISKLSDK